MTANVLGLLPERHSVVRQTKYITKSSLEFLLFSRDSSPRYGSKPYPMFTIQ
jgi:hypothetical protein